MIKNIITFVLCLIFLNTSILAKQSYVYSLKAKEKTKNSNLTKSNMRMSYPVITFHYSGCIDCIVTITYYAPVRYEDILSDINDICSLLNELCDDDSPIYY
ncbi:MAG: hypothetical protein JST94_02385 [Bacteroidetes bacterium]|nr:hypothetical protein [Bacteroidota bacterium]MBS1670294.1 hypothetical protein [Bacteroidota bacterium]